VVADVLSRIPCPTLNSLLALHGELCEEFKKLEINMVMRHIRPMLYTIEVQPTPIEEIRAAKSTDPQLNRIKAEVLAGNAPGFMIHEDEMLRFQNWVYVLTIEELKKKNFG